MRDIIDATMDGEAEDFEPHDIVLAIIEAESHEEAFSCAVVAMAAHVAEGRKGDDWDDERMQLLRNFAADALMLLPGPALCVILAQALMELAEQTVDAEHAAEPIPVSEHPSNPDAKVNTEPVSSVLPVGTYVRVETDGTANDTGISGSYVGVVRGYDIGQSKYNIGRRYTSWDEFKFGDGGWWCFLSEATEITREEAHAK